MSKLDRLQKRAEAAVERDGAAQHEAKAGFEGSMFKTPPAGKCRMRLAGYIEIGKQKKVFKGEEKLQDQFILRFTCYGQGEDYVNDDGTPVTIDSFPIGKSHSGKSQAVQMFNDMCPLKDADHYIGLMATRVFWGEIIHKEVPSKEEGKKPMIFANIKRGSIKPGVVDVMDDNYNVIGQKPVAAPELDESMIQLFEWDMPSKEDFDELRSSDQKRIREAANFKGSAIEALVGAGNPAASDAPEDEPADDEPPFEPDAPEDNGTPKTAVVSDDDLPAL